MIYQHINLILCTVRINDFTIHVDDKNPCINTRVLEDILDLKVFNGLNIPKTALDHATLFIERSKQMNSICNVYNTKFYRFLQPTLGFGNYIYDLSDPYDTVFKRINDGNDSYHAVERLKTYYSKIINLIDIEKCSFIYNLTHIFDGKSRLFKTSDIPYARLRNNFAKYHGGNILNVNDSILFDSTRSILNSMHSSNR